MIVKKLLGSNTSHGKLLGFQISDLKLLDQNGNPITNFTGKIKVKIPIPAGMSGNLHVYWYDLKSGSLTDMGATQENGYVVFYTTHFSDYAVAQFDSSVSSETSKPVENSKTGDEGWPLLPLAFLGGGSAAGLILAKRRKIFRRKENNA
jgi:LPXTG-motif cell wall-anchored protein